MPKIALEAAALIGVVAATIAGVSYALGTVAQLAYFGALGLDARQFPPLGLELHVRGLRYALPPALCIGLIVLAYASVLTWMKRNTVMKGLFLLSLLMMAVTAVMLYFTPEPLSVQSIRGAGASVTFAAISVLILFIGWSLLGRWVPPVFMGCLLGAAILLFVIKFVNDSAAGAGKARAAEAGKSIAASTIIELTDGNKITVPGVRVACSERFCGFHDGKRATVISLEGVRSIQLPQEQPSPTSGK